MSFDMLGPHMRCMSVVAEGDSIELLQEELTHLSQHARVSIQGKITSKKIATWLKGTSSLAAVSPPGDQLQQDDDDDDDEDIQDEDGYLSDLSTLSNGEVGMDESYSFRVGGAGRLLRRAISLEDMKDSSSAAHHLILRSDQPERPASASMCLPVGSDTLPPVHHPLQPPYELEYHSYPHPSSSYIVANNRSTDRSGMTSHLHADSYAVFDADRPFDPMVLTQTPEREYLDDPLATFVSRPGSSDSKPIRFAYAASSTQADHAGMRARSVDETTLAANERAPGGSLAWFNASPLLDTIVNWVEGPANYPGTKKSDKPNPLLDIPFQFIAMLTYPELDPGNKPSLAVLLFMSNCGMLFLMKNSGRINVTMAKGAVNQRVGWAKQWAEGIFRKSGSVASNNIQDSASHDPQGASYSNTNSRKHASSLSTTHTERDHAGTASVVGEKAESTVDGNMQIKRRGLFRKRKTLGSNGDSNTNSSSVAQNGSGSSTIPSFLDGGAGGDDASVMANRTRKRGFFKRSAISRSATAPPIALSDVSNNAPTTKPPPVPILPGQPGTSLHNGAMPLRDVSLLPASNLSQTQSLPHPQLLLPRSPSPNVIRKDVSWSKPWGSTSQPSQQQPNPDSAPSSGTTSMCSSPKVAPVTIPIPQSPGRLLTSINPRLFLPGFSQSQRQQQQQQRYPHPQHEQQSLSLSMSIEKSVAPTPISPQPRNAIGLSTSAILGGQHGRNQEQTRAQEYHSFDIPGATLFEDELGEPFVTHTPLPTSKYSTSPELLAVSSLVGIETLELQGIQSTDQRQQGVQNLAGAFDAGEDMGASTEEMCVSIVELHISVKDEAIGPVSNTPTEAVGAG
ncbi:hypothetical protein BGZ54_006117 [Gamsiella multidivaricata]|nr:hypothetical protein BGZ54_006117 [Gamsiella multidivaricata]